MKASKKICTFLTILALTLLTAMSAQAFNPATDTVNLTVSDATVNASGASTVDVYVTVDDASAIAGAAFTVIYDTEDLELTNVASNFFGTFSSQNALLPVGATPFPTDVLVGVDTYDQPLVYTETTMAQGTMLAAARVEAPGGSAASATLFTLTFDVSNAFNGVYPIIIRESSVNNPAAGYDPTANPPTDDVPPLVGAATDASGNPLPLDGSQGPAFPLIMVNMSHNGEITVYGSDSVDSYTITTQSPFNVDSETHVPSSEDWNLWFHGDNNLEFNGGATVCKTTLDSLAWTSATPPDSAICDTTATTSIDLIADDVGSIYLLTIPVEEPDGTSFTIYALFKLTAFNDGSDIGINFLPVGNWYYGHDENDLGCGGSASISGTVFSAAADGSPLTPLTGIAIDVFSDTVWCGSRILTDENGAYTASGLIAGSYQVSYRPASSDELHSGEDAYRKAFWSSSGTVNKWDQAELIYLSDAASETGKDLTLSAGTTISGTITVTGTNIFPAWVEAYADELNAWGGTKVDAPANPGDPAPYTITGLSESDPLSNVYRVVVRPYSDSQTNTQPPADFTEVWYNGGNGTRMWDNAVLIPAPSTGINFNISDGATISGTVTEDGFQGVAGVWVNAWSETAEDAQAEGAWGGAVTDADGNYTIKGLNNTYSDYIVGIYDPNYASQSKTGISTIAGIDFILISGETEITGAVRDEGGQPVNWVWVEAYSPSQKIRKGANSGENPDWTFNDSGTYTIKGLPPANDYILKAFPMMGQPIDYKYNPVDLLSTATATGIDFTLTAGKHIAGRVTEASGGAPVGGVIIDAYSESTWGWNNATTDAAGNYTITNLQEADDYIVSYWPDSYSGKEYKQKFWSSTGTANYWEDAGTIDITTGSADGIDLTLTTGASISGTVSGAHGGIPWVWVDAFETATGNWGGAANTDGTGAYKITGLADGTPYTVTAYPSNKPAAEYPTPVTATADDTPNIDFDVTTIQGKQITGKVTSDGSTGIANAEVFAWSMSTQSFGFAITDINGNFTILNLESASDFEVYVYANGINISPLTNIASGDAGITPLDITVDEANKISGSISGISGTGWHIWVDAWSKTDYTAWGYAQAVYASPDSYDYTIKGLKGTVSDYQVSIGGFNPETGESLMMLFYDGNNIGTTNWENAASVDLTAGDQTGINFTVQAGKFISGTISLDSVDAASDPRLEFIQVSAFSDSTYGFGWAQTDINGNYKITGLLPASDYRVDVWKEGYPFLFYNETAPTPIWENATLVDVSQDDKTGIDLTLSKGGAIGGTVKNTNNTPIEGAWIDIHSPTQFSGGGTYTDQQGWYRVEGLQKGVNDYEVTVFPGGNYKQVTKSDKSVGDIVDFTLSGAFTFYGKLINQSDSSAYTGGAYVDIFNDEFYGWADVSADSSTFAISGLANGDYQIVIWPWESGYIIVDSTLSGLTSASSSAAAPLDLTLSSGVSISGTVMDDNGAGISGAYVDAYNLTNGNYAEAGSDGTFTINGLSDGAQYTLFVWAQGYPNLTTSVTAPATGQQLTLSTGGSITGTVKYNGAPQSGVLVEAGSEAYGSWGSAITGADGSYTISGLKINTINNTTIKYNVIVKPDNLAWQSQTNQSVGDVVNFNLISGDFLSGTVQKSDGSALNNARVMVFNAGGGVQVKSQITGDDGTFDIKGLDSGNYQIKIKASGYGAAWYASDDPYIDGSNRSNDGRAAATNEASGTSGITIKLTAN